MADGWMFARYKKCPCSNWWNCPQYTDQRTLQQRLESKQYNFHEYYENVFKIEYIMPDSVPNG